MRILQRLRSFGKQVGFDIQPGQASDRTGIKITVFSILQAWIGQHQLLHSFSCNAACAVSGGVLLDDKLTDRQLIGLETCDKGVISICDTAEQHTHHGAAVGAALQCQGACRTAAFTTNRQLVQARLADFDDFGGRGGNRLRTIETGRGRVQYCILNLELYEMIGNGITEAVVEQNS